MNRLSKADKARREFLGGVLAGGAATALLAMTAVASDKDEAVPVSASAEQKPKGYHVTPHIRTYYEKAQM